MLRHRIDFCVEFFFYYALALFFFVCLFVCLFVCFVFTRKKGDVACRTILCTLRIIGCSSLCIVFHVYWTLLCQWKPGEVTPRDTSIKTNIKGFILQYVKKQEILKLRRLEGFMTRTVAYGTRFYNRCACE